STYTVTVSKGMPATDDAVLGEDYSEGVAIPDLDPPAGFRARGLFLPAAANPAVDFQSQGIFLAAAGKHTVALESVNVPKVRMTIDRVFLNNLFFLFQYGGFFEGDTGYFDELPHALGDRLKEETLDIGGARNQRRVTPITLDKYVDTKEPGLYRVSVGQPDDYEANQRWLLLTDLGAVAKRGRSEFQVWVSSLTDLSAVE